MMNIFNKVTLQSLKKNKTRTFVTIIGIMLSAAMICSVTTLVSSVYNYIFEYSVYNNGGWHGSALNTDYDTYQKISSSDSVEKTVYSRYIGYSVAEGCTNDYKPYLFIIAAGDDFGALLPIHITSGRYPTSSDEILLPNHLSENGEVIHSLGDVLTLEIGDRMIDGYTLTQENPFNCDDSGDEIISFEELQIRETKKYTVVGFYERPAFESYSSPGYTAITLDDTSVSTGNYDVYFKMEKAKETYAFMTSNELTGNMNSSILAYSGVFAFESMDFMIYGLATIIIGLIIFGSVSLIYNAFSISVSERTRQFGLLSSIGATKKQLRQMVFFEAFVVSSIGIPLGIIAGIGGIGVTLALIGNKFDAIMGSAVSLKLSTSPLYILAAVIIALLTVLISVWIPSKRATKVSAVQAIRQNLDISSKGKPVKTSKLIYRLFGLPGVLAVKYYKRSRRKYRATVISLFMSIVLFVSASAFTDYMMEAAAQGLHTADYDLTYATRAGKFKSITKEDLLNLFKEDEAITAASYNTRLSYGATVRQDILSEQAIKYSHHFCWSVGDTSDYLGINVTLCFVDDATFFNILREYNLDEDKFYNSSSPLAIGLNRTTLYDSMEERYISFNLLSSKNGEVDIQIINEDTFESDTAYDTISIKYGALIEDSPYFFEQWAGSGLTFIYPDSFMKELFSEPLYSKYEDYGCTYYLKSDNHAASYDALRETLNENGLYRNGLIDYAAMAEENRNIFTIIQVFAYGFITLISLIAAANVFNTISTNISLRRREFAMLKSIGMTSKGLNKMMNFECMLYGSKALLYGLPVSFLITFIIYIIVSEGYMMGFRLPVAAILIAILSVFIVVFATMMYSMSKIKKENPIDSLKNENI